MAEFPATNLLGFGLDFTTASPVDTNALVITIKRAHRIIQFDTSDTRRLVVGDVEYDVPKEIAVLQVSMAGSGYVTFKNGSEATSRLLTDSGLSTRFLAMSTNDSMSYSISKTHRRQDQWAMRSINAYKYHASLQEYADLLAETDLVAKLQDMTPIGDGSDGEVIRQWKEFFAHWGTHVIVNASFGARFQLNVWASNSDDAVSKKFSTSVNAVFNGIGDGGKFDADVKKEPRYKKFLEMMQKTVSIIGGDSELADKLRADPTNYEKFEQWSHSMSRNPDVISLTVAELWGLMWDAVDEEIRGAADKVEKAYNFIVKHPRVYRTGVLLDIQSDWGEFNLLSSSAIIVPDPARPFPDKTVDSNVRVLWGREHSHEYEQKQLRFFIVNDGSPIDFSTSRGSDGAKPGSGRVEVTIEEKSYVNETIKDNVLNTMWFYQTPVSTVPAPTDLTEAGYGRD